jgi:CDP-diglyceride synthetase
MMKEFLQRAWRVVGDEIARASGKESRLLLGLLVGLGLMAGLVPLTDYFGRGSWSKNEYHSIIVWILAVWFAPALGSILYGVRCRRPRFYGIAEIGVGTFLTVLTLHVLIERALTNNAAIFTFLAALYVIVRGFDNIHRSIPAGTESMRRWNQVFFGKDTDAKL